MNIQPYQIAVIEDNEFLRHQIHKYFNQSAFITCLLCVDTVEKFLKYHQPEQKIHLILLNISHHDHTGLDALGLLHKRLPNTEIIMFSMSDDPDSIFQALGKGASGYLLKGQSMNELEQKIVNILEGRDAPLSASVSKTILSYFQKLSIPDDHKVLLSEQEMTIARFLIDGLPYEKIAAKLDIGVNGIRYHVKKIYGKLNINSRYQLINWYNIKNKVGL